MTDVIEHDPNEGFLLDGERLLSFRTGWRNAVRQAGLPSLTPLDMRRSAARIFVRARAPEKVVMDLCGWKTRGMFDRYNTTYARDLAEGVERLGACLSDFRPSVTDELQREG